MKMKKINKRGDLAENLTLSYLDGRFTRGEPAWAMIQQGEKKIVFRFWEFFPRQFLTQVDLD